MTLADLWDVLAAAEAVAIAHGWDCVPMIRRRLLWIELRRGPTLRHVVLTEAQWSACASTAALRELVEREVAKVLRLERGAVA